MTGVLSISADFNPSVGFCVQWRPSVEVQTPAPSLPWKYNGFAGVPRFFGAETKLAVCDWGIPLTGVQLSPLLVLLHKPLLIQQ